MNHIYNYIESHVGIALIFACFVHSYFPNGASGVFSGSATLFFAYIGFDAVASTAEEVGLRDLII
jgi:amino acid transporter